MIVRTSLFAAVSVAALLAQSADRDELLARGRERALETINRMPRYTCTETVDRSEFEQVVPRLDQRSCDQILANRANHLSKLELTRTDRLRIDVQVADGGFEMFSWPGSSRMSSERVEDFAGEGLLGTGAFGPFLIDIFANPGVKFWPEGPARMDGVELTQYRYLVPPEASHYRIVAAGATRVVPYEGRFWLDPGTADVRRLMVRTGELSRSTGNCEAATTVDFLPAQIGTGEHLMATRSVLHAVRRDAVEQENITTYAACHEFHGDVAIHFDEGDEVAPGEPAAGVPGAAPVKAQPASFPPGVRVTIRFEGGIDRAKSAAGDILLGTARHTLRNPKKRLLPVAGAPVRCRIVRQENNVRAARLDVAVACESVEWNGRWTPFAAAPDKGEDLSEYLKGYSGTAPMPVTKRGYATRQPAFVFHAGQAETGPLTLDWITIVPPKPPAKR